MNNEASIMSQMKSKMSAVAAAASGGGGLNSRSVKIAVGSSDSARKPLSSAEAQEKPLCGSCHQFLSEPCLLVCYHVLCANCLKSSASNVKDNKLPCPICGKLTLLRDGDSYPPVDNLLRILMESTFKECPSCANCDRNEKSPMFFCNTCVCWSSQRDCDHILTMINNKTGIIIGEVTNLPMFYCNTCGQALCSSCRDDTHRAKMFSQHDIIHMSKKIKEVQKKCPTHGEPLTMFCAAKRSLICSKCYRETAPELRFHCQDIESAYRQGAKKMEKALITTRDFNSSLRDGMMVFRTLVEELRQNVESERSEITNFYSKILESLKKTYEALIKDLENQYESKDQEFQAQLNNLGTILPTIQMHLLLCTTFTSTANKLEFLSMAYDVIDRLTAITNLTFPLRPGRTSDVHTDYPAHFSRCLESLITANFFITDRHSGRSGGAISSSSRLSMTTPSSSVVNPTATLPPATTSAATPSTHSLGRKSSGKHNKDREFIQHCRAHEAQVKELNKRFNGIKTYVSELHQEIMARRCSSSFAIIENIVHESSLLKAELEKTERNINDKRMVISKLWDQEQQKIINEQTVFKDQLCDLNNLRHDLHHIISVTSQIEPYVKSLMNEEGTIQTQQQQSQPPPPPPHQPPPVISVAQAGPSQLQQQQHYLPTMPPHYPHHHQAMEPQPELDIRQRQNDRIKQLLEQVQRAEDLKYHHNQQGTLLRPPRQGKSRHPEEDVPVRDLPLSNKSSQITSSEMADLCKAILQHQHQLEEQQNFLQQQMQHSKQQHHQMPSSEHHHHHQYSSGPQRLSPPPPTPPPPPQSNSDSKRGILSSILEKVRPRNDDQDVSKDGSKIINKKSNESLASVEGIGGANKRFSSKISEISSDSQCVHKPFEPPVLGKPTRVTPVGLDEGDNVSASGVYGQNLDKFSTDSCLESDSVEVLSVIRFNKMKFQGSGTPIPGGTGSCSTSEKRSSSSADTNSLFNPPSSCPSCDRRKKQNPQQQYFTLSRRSRSQSEGRSKVPLESEDEEPDSRADAAGSSVSLPSTILRRSSAPEIDNDDLLSESQQEEGRDLISRQRRLSSDRYSSDESDTIPPPCRYSVGTRTFDRRSHNQSQVKAVVHRGAESVAKRASYDALVSLRGDEDPRSIKKTSGIKHSGSHDSLTGAGCRALSSEGPLKKADSFEGHEEAVRTLVEAVQESRKLDSFKKKSTE